MLVSPVKYNLYELNEGAQLYLVAREPIEVFPDQIYSVHGVFTQNNTTYFLIVDSSGVPEWLPAEIFSVVDPKVKDDWVIDVFEGGKEIIIGPNYLAKDTNYFTLLSERDNTVVEDFINRQSH